MGNRSGAEFKGGDKGLKVLLFIVISILLLLIFFQDLKYRAISWFIIPLLVLSFILYTFKEVGKYEYLHNLIINILLVIIQYVFLTVYVSVKKRKLVNLLNIYLGLGDVLFFLVMAFALSPINFILFNMVSLLFICLIVLIFRIYKSKYIDKVPLAGFQSFMLFILMIVEESQVGFQLMNDYFILSKINLVYA